MRIVHFVVLFWLGMLLSNGIFSQEHPAEQAPETNSDSLEIEGILRHAFDLASDNFKKARKEGLKALRRADSLENNYLKAKAYNRLGVVYYYYSGYNRALQYTFRALKMNEALNYKPGMARDLNNIGMIYSELKQYENAVPYYKKSLRLNVLMDREKGLAKNYNNLGIIMRHRSKLDSALDYYNKARWLNRELHDSTSLAYNYNNMGNVYNDVKNYAKAKTAYKQALEINQKIDNKSEQARNYFNLADVAVHEGNLTEATRMVEKGNAMNKQVQSVEMEIDYLEVLINLRKAQKRKDVLPALYERLMAINDSIYRQTLEKERQRLHVRYEVAQKNEQIALLEAKNQAQSAKIRNQRIIRTSLGFITVLLVVISVLLLSRYKLKVRMNKQLEDEVEARTADLEEAKERAEESDQLKTAFLANMSHEIRTPMHAIAGYTEMLQDESAQLPAREKNEMMQAIQENSNVLIRLIDNIIDMAKIEAGQIRLQKKNTRPFEIASAVYHAFQPLAIEKQLRFEMEVKDADKALTLETDPDRMQQVLEQLVENAFKFTEKGNVTLGYQVEEHENGQWLGFFVADTGMGISEKQRTLIFERFGKVDSQDGKLFRGAGLGLSIASHFVEMMGGRLQLDSTPGQGSVFYFRLPL